MENMTISLTDGQFVKFTYIEDMAMVCIELTGVNGTISNAHVTIDDATWVQNSLNYYIKSIKENGN